MERGDGTDREFRLGQRTSRDPASVTRGFEVFEDEQARTLLAIHRAEVAPRRAERAMVGQILVEADLPLIEAHGVQARPGLRVRWRKLRDEGTRAGLLDDVVVKVNARQLPSHSFVLAEQLGPDTGDLGPREGAVVPKR